MTSETSEHDNSSHVPSIANTTNMFPPKRKNRSEAWNHFIPEVGSSPKAAKCNYCETLIQYNNGTSSMRAHLGRCPLNPANLNRMHDTASSSVDTEGVVSSSPSYPKFDQDACRVSVVNMFIALEIPFNKVDHPRLHKAFYDLQPRYKVQSRTTLTPTSVEALVCTQDWLEGARLCSLTSEDFDALERIEEEMFVTQDVSGSSSSIALNDD